MHVVSKVPLSAHLDLPAWFWGGDVEDYFTHARLRASRNEANDRVVVQAEERLGTDRPHLIRSTELHGPLADSREPFLNSLETQALAGLNMQSLVEHVDTEMHLRRLIDRAAGPMSSTSLAAGFAAHQLQTMAAPASQLEDVVEAVWQDLRNITFVDSGQRAFPHASAHFLSRDPAVLHRMKLASVLLRLQHDDALKNADIREAVLANARGELVFAASTGHSEGVMTLDAYLAPLFGALTPFVWACPAGRASGTVVYALGLQVSGNEGEAAEPMQLLPSRGPDGPSTAPQLTSRSAEATIAWWARRLDGLFGVLSDPAVFTDGNLNYAPSKHLHAQLSIEQLFRRTASIQHAHRDSDARRVLLFTTLDTLERVSSRSLTTMCKLSLAQRTLESLRDDISTDVAALLLPAAQRAVDALARMQNGFFLARQAGRSVVEFIDTTGSAEQLSLEDATAEYLRVLRNATHGHGSNRQDAKLKTDALLAHHDGSFPHDLALLGYLYLLDLLVHPDHLRRKLWDGGAP